MTRTNLLAASLAGLLLWAWAAAAASPSAAAPAPPPVEGASRLAKSHFLKGSLLEKRGEYVQALQEYEKAFSYDPGSAYICRQAAQAAIEAGKNDDAAVWVAKLDALDPANPQTKVLVGRVQWVSGKVEEAERTFEEALKLNPQASDTIFSLASLLSTRSPEKAKKLFLRYMEEDPDNAVEGHYQIGLMEAREGKVKEAEASFRAALGLEPDSLSIRYSLAELYEVARDTDAALAEYLEIQRLDSRNVELVNHIGEIYQVKGMLDEARAQFESAKALSPSDPVSSLYLATLCEARGEHARAAEHLKTSAALKDDIWLNLRLSYFLTQAGRLKEAVAVLEDAARRWPANDEVAYYLSLGYDDLKLGPKAIALLRSILARKPAYRDARYQLAVLLERYGKMDEAEKEFRRLLEANPDDAGILNYLGYSLADRGAKLDDAEELIDRAVELDPKNGAFQDSLGWVYFKQGRSTESVRELEGAVRKLPEDSTIWDHLGDAHSQAGDPEAAWRAWMKAQSLEPSSVKFGKKAARVQDKFDPVRLGGFFLDHVGQVQGGIEKYSGLCEVKMMFLGKTFTYNGVLTARGAALDVDILGPLFTPIMRARLGEDGFTMDPIRIEGVSTEALMDEAFRAFQTMSDYLSGKVFRDKPVTYGASWFNQWVEMPDSRLFLGADRLRVERLEPKDKEGVGLALGDFVVQRGRHVPSRLTVEGKGFRLAIKMKGLNVVFK
ncbi:MAG: tetratricopeptide repeat protein [Elusimicrobia bacterium]|nr:tetratricopeptide repeat protein [Elusimicrobiota bacterium]